MEGDEDQNQAQAQADLAGYPSVDELVKGYRQSSQEAKKLKDRAERAEQAFQVLQTQSSQRSGYAENPRQDVVKRDPYQVLADYGVPVDPIREAVRMEAREELRTSFEPIMKGFQARQTMLGKYKDYQKFESDIASFIQEDQGLSDTYNRMFQADPVGAFEYAYLKFGQNSRERRSGAAGTPGREAAEAQLPNQRSGDSRRAPQGYDAQAQDLLKEYQQNPSRRNAEAYVRARLRSSNVITDEFLNQ